MPTVDTFLRTLLPIALVSVLGSACAASDDTAGHDDSALNAAASRGGNVPVVSKGSGDGHVALVDLPASVVQALLPPELELAPQQDLSPAGMHPVAIGFWKHSGVVGLAPGSPPPIDYQELAILIPYVEYKTGVDCVEHVRGPFSYMPYLFLDNQQPLDIGVQFYGYAKHMAAIEASDSAFAVTSPDGKTALAHAAFGAPVALPSVTPTAIAQFERVLQTPLLGKLANGNYVWSNLDWQLGSATLATSTIDLGFTDASPILAGVPLQQSATIPGLAMHMDWTLSAPVVCAQ